MAPSAEKQAGKLLGLLAEEGREYGDLVAERLVELVRSQPRENRDDLHRQLVSGAATYLSHTAWYARVAAASCLESLARLEYEQEELPSPLSGKRKEGGDDGGGGGGGGCGGGTLTDELARGWVSLGDVRLAEVLERGALLLSHGEDTAKVDAIDSHKTENASADVGARVGRQRKRLLRCLGLAGGSGEARAGSLYSSIGDAIEDEDLANPPASSTVKRAAKGGSGRSTASVTPTSGNEKDRGSESGAGAQQQQQQQQQLSARQKNRLAREARSDAAAASGSAAKGKRRRSSAGGGGDGGGDGGGQEGREDGPPAFLGRGSRGGMLDVASSAREALVSLAADLVAQLFHPIWQCRHGAALGALSILRAWNARRRRGELVPYGDRMAAWAEDAVARCVCVLALDRFGDYSGRMVAPVRETAAQLFAVAALQLDADGLKRAATLLSELTSAEEWQARHGGFCGLESLSAVAISGDGADGRGAPPREVAAFLRDLVYCAAVPRGLSDPAEDVCAAAARAVRLVMRRFLLPVKPLQAPEPRKDRGVPESGDGGGGSCGNAAEAEAAVMPAQDELPRVGRGAPGFATGGEGGTTGSGGGGGDVFDLIWKALEDLDQDSACVEDLADLLETCCEDMGRTCGAIDPFLSSGEQRLSRLLDLWGDHRAKVRACAVRSLLALATGMVRATRMALNARPSGSTGSVAAAAAAAAAAVTAAGRCESLLRRCFSALVSEKDDGVRDHFVRLWRELLMGLGCADDHTGAAHASLTTWCLDLLFTQTSPSSPPSPSPALDEGGTVKGRIAERAPADSANDQSSSSSLSPSRGSGRRPSKRARNDRAVKNGPGKLSVTAAVATSSSACPQQQRKQAEVSNEVEGLATASPDAGATAGAAGATATFFARLAAVEALAELARAAAAAAVPTVATSRACDDGAGGSTAAVAAPAGTTAAGSRRRQDRGGGKRSGGKSAVMGDAGAGAGAPARRGGDVAYGNPVNVRDARAEVRELIVSQVARRAGSGWAWERELAFFLMEACCAGGGRGGGGVASGGGSAPASGKQYAWLSESEHGAWAAVDRALATNNSTATAEGTGVFRELEGVDKAVSSACSGVIRALLQDAAAGTADPANPATGSGASTDSGAAGDTAAAASAPAARRPSQRGKNLSHKSRSRNVGKAAATAGAAAAVAAPPAAVGSNSSKQVTPPASQGVAMVERMFVSLAAAFGETLVPLGRGASRQEKEAVWTGRVRHFHARIQEQQAALAKRVASAAASVYAGIRPLPSELNPVLRPLVSAVKKEPDAQRRGRSASRLAHLAASLLGDATRSERRDAGAMVLFGLASLAGKGQQQQNLDTAVATAAVVPHTTEGMAAVAADVARDGSTETLRHAMALASSPASPSLSSSSAAPVFRTAAAPAWSSPPALGLSSVTSSRRSTGGGRDKKRENEPGDGRDARGEGGEAGGAGYEKAVGDWAVRTLAPLLQHPSFCSKTHARDAAETAAGSPERRKLSAAESKKSPAEIRATDLSAALGVADALLQAAREPPVADGDRRRGAVAGARWPLLASLLVETPLAAGLLALACSGCVPVVPAGEDDDGDAKMSTEGCRTSAPSGRRQRQQKQPQHGGRNGGSSGVAEGTSRVSAGQSVDGGGGGDGGGGSGDTAAAEAMSAATADAALFIVKDAAALFPEGLWLGVRAELLPTLAAGPVSSSGRGGGSERIGESTRGGGGGGGVRGVGVAGGVRAGLVLKEVVSGMGTGVVPFAARLLPVALRGMTDSNEEFRGLLAGTFNELVKAVALAADGDGDGDDDARTASAAADDSQAGIERGTNNLAGRASSGRLHGQPAAGLAKAAGDSVEEDGELIVRHLVRGEPLPRLHRGLLPAPLARTAAAGVTLRPYQWEGIAWLDFLRRIGAHGILADDMGLGKTLQALMAVAMCHHHNNPGRRSLVVCPSMLVHHWQVECSRYFGGDILRPVVYAGPTKVRRQIAERLGLGPGTNSSSSSSSGDNAAGHAGSRGGEAAAAPAAAAAAATAEGVQGEGLERHANVVITSYNVLRADSEILGQQGWLYLVLDEAHLLRNPATRTAKAARALRSNHRVGLTGTPIQNSVLELWSLFQFLMPGYLGDRRSFQREVARPVRAALSADGDGKATVEGLRELEKLHRQVLPFVLRREKSEVLADLPPKIVTEMLCDLTPEQRRLHNLWERGGDGGRVMAAVAEAEATETARLRAAADAAAAAGAALEAAAAAAETAQRPTGGTTDGNDPATSWASTPSPASSAARASSNGSVSGVSVSVGSADAAAASMGAVRGVSTSADRLSVGAQTLTCLSKLQLLCVHPSLVSTSAPLEQGRVRQGVRDCDKARGGDASDVRLSGKLMALRELLWDAGIGKRQRSATSSGGGDDDGELSSCDGTDSDDSDDSDVDEGFDDVTGDGSSSSDDSDGEDEDEDEEVEEEKEEEKGKREPNTDQQSSGNRGQQVVGRTTDNSRKRGRKIDEGDSGGAGDINRPTRTLARRGRSSTTSSSATRANAPRGSTSKYHGDGGGGGDNGDGDGVGIKRSGTSRTRNARAKKASIKHDAAAGAAVAGPRASPSLRQAAASSAPKGKNREKKQGEMPPPLPTSSAKKRCLPRDTEETPATMTTTSTDASPASPPSPASPVSSALPGCKCLVFAQHKAALDVTESALLRPCFPGVTYLRMDGSVPQGERAAVVDRFSADPSVAILLLTTRVGHLGLNLSAASMVVFLEHDWNPQVDLQAMDRAHRLGQRKAVNVYRLIAANSIEQRVLRLQGHKLDVAGAVVDRENASAFSSGTGGVLGMLGEAMAVVAAAASRSADGGDAASNGEGGGEGGVELWSADEDYAYLAAERLADSVARE